MPEYFARVTKEAGVTVLDPKYKLEEPTTPVPKKP